MGELLFCNEPIAAMPYFIEDVSLNIYSIEELCYFINNNTLLIERDFMSEELCTWIDKELNRLKLADSLREIMHSAGKLSDFIFKILEDSGYCTMEEMQNIIFQIRQMEEKSDFECNKIRADKLMENEKYLSSIYEYKRLLSLEEAMNESPVIVGNIWHNLGTAYARLFLFKEAITCYKKAYRMNNKQESLIECLMAYRCLHDDAGFVAYANKCGISEETMDNIKAQLSELSRGEVTEKFEQDLEAIAMLSDTDKEKYNREINDIILNWKRDYRKICKV